MTTLLKLGFTAGRWGDQKQVKPWLTGLTALASSSVSGGNFLLLALAKYPASLLFYCLGIGAVAAENWSVLQILLNAPMIREHREDKRAVELLAIWELYEHDGQVMRILPGRERQHTPLQNHIEELLLPMFREQFSSDEAFKLAFDRFEVLSALSYAAVQDWATSFNGYWAPPGSYGWRSSNRQRIIKELREQLASGGPLQLVIGRDLSHARENLDQLEKFVPQLRW